MISTRRQNGKSRNGCQQCKIRRLKCDEKKPECSRCLEQHLVCPGYCRKLRWSRKHERFPTGPRPSDGTRICATDAECAGHEREATTTLTRRTKTTVENLTPVTSVASVTATIDSYDLVNQRCNGEDCTSQSPISRLESASAYRLSRRPVSILHSSDSTSQNLQRCLTYAADSKLYRNPTDLPTLLIEYWFSSVCPMWSTFDSDVNFNRRIARDNWSSSKPVFYAMQTMSAACLADSMPQLKNFVPGLVKQTTAAIREGIAVVRSLAGVVLIDLVFAVFALGTSSHWTEPSSLSELLIVDACYLLQSWKSNEDLTAIETILYAYFDQALIYWQMLLSIFRSSSGGRTLEQRRVRYGRSRIQATAFNNRGASPNEGQSKSCGSPLSLEGSRPNSWCGVSSEVIDLFGQVLALCRSVRDRHRCSGNFLTVEYSHDPLRDINLARDFEAELLAMDFNAVMNLNERLGFSLQTFDEKTPISHLLHVAQAYRHASLLQLYLTFENLDLVLVPADLNTIESSFSWRRSFDTSRSLSRTQRLAAFALELVSILEKIPGDSGSKSIQIVLYLSAAAGLRFDTHPQQSESGARALSTVEADEQLKTNSLEKRHWSLSGLDEVQRVPTTPTTRDYHYSDVAGLKLPYITYCNWEVSQARHFILTRLAMLQQTLPPRPVNIALDLVKAIWTVYDDDSEGRPNNVHWLDVMMDTGLQTLFG